MLAFWILDPLYNLLGGIIAGFYAVIPNFAAAIILLTATVSLLRMPLVAKQVKSQQAMQRIQPEIKRIQAKYKADPAKRNEALMAAYKEHQVNPLASCLPLVLQMPLFIVLYRLILSLSSDPPKHLPHPSRLFNALVDSGGKMQALGMDLSQRASDMEGSSLIPIGILIVLVVGTGLFQARQMQARMPKDAINPQMAIIGKVFPVMFGAISFTIPAGVVLYFLISNCWQIGQQAFMFRHGPPGGARPATGKDAAVTEPDPPPSRGRSGGTGGTGANRSAKGAKGKGGPRPQDGRSASGGVNRRTRPPEGGSSSANRKSTGKPDPRKPQGRSPGKPTGRPTGRPGAGGGASGSGRSSGRVTPPGGRNRSGPAPNPPRKRSRGDDRKDG